MKNLKIGENYTIHCYKHNGTVHRSWDEATLLDVNKDFLVFGNSKARVNNSDGRIWYTKEPAIIFYYKDKWYNVITQFKDNGISKRNRYNCKARVKEFDKTIRR